ncbi:MAG: peptidase [Bacteroidetes bacterium]|jgi:Mlc titration factor MtfA (ptsG expression regulator)|nr:peptidase [Bacteroidota bacterium]
MSTILIVLLLVGILILLIVQIEKNYAWQQPEHPFPSQWRAVLSQKVPFYQSLSKTDKKTFEYEVQEFLLNCQITGIETEVTATDRLLVAASAVIPIFHFPEWRYANLSEVLLYKATFNRDFQTEGEERRILGMVGTGFMNGQMILSKPALHLGFANETDKKNTAIHEFVHLLDKADGTIDGIPERLLEKQYVLPWMQLMEKKIDEIYEGRSDINPYGGTKKSEFYAVVAEYFFERPHLLKKKHPELYGMLDKIFDTPDRAGA